MVVRAAGLALACVTAWGTALAGEKPPLTLRVVYPLEGASIPAVDSTFVFGQVSDAKATLEINGRAVPVYRTGGFLAYVPLTAGDMTLDLFARHDDDTTRVLRHVSVAARPQPLPAIPFVAESAGADPSDDREVLPGDAIPVRVRASTGARAWFELRGRRYPMAEAVEPRGDDPRIDAFAGGMSAADTTHSGVLTGVYVVQPGDSLAQARVTITVVSADSSDTTLVRPVGRITTIDTRVPRIVEFTDSLTVGRAGPNAGYSLFIPRGVRAWMTGSRGSWWRIRCAEGVAVWVAQTSARVLPPGTAVPRPRLGTVRVDEGARDSRVSLTVSPPVPYRIDEFAEPAAMRVQFYGAVADIDWIRYARGAAGSDSADTYIPSVTWTQPSSEIAQLDIALAGQRVWGYAAGYANAVFSLALRRPPLPVEKKHGFLHKTPKPLSRLLIALDPGHAPDTGASGPTGLLERDATLAITRELGERLESLGARVYYTRPDTTGVPLVQRPRLAAAAGADLLISVHLNALPDGVNPFSHRGSSVYFYYPHSQRLAECVHDALLTHLGLPDFGVYYGNLALTRPPQMPAILTESTFLMHPEEEEALRVGTRRHQIVDAISEGVLAFMDEQSWADEQPAPTPLDGTRRTP